MTKYELYLLLVVSEKKWPNEIVDGQTDRRTDGRTDGQTDGRTTPDGPGYDKLRGPPVTAELKSGMLAFKMAARRPSWIGSTQFFVYRWALWGYILIPNLACLPLISHCENFPQKRFRLRRTTTDDGRKVNAIACWSFGPSGLKTIFRFL